MGCYNAAELERNQSGTHEQRRADHAVRDQLGWHREEEKGCLGPALILHGCVAERSDEALEEKDAAEEDPVDELCFGCQLLKSDKKSSRRLTGAEM